GVLRQRRRARVADRRRLQAEPRAGADHRCGARRRPGAAGRLGGRAAGGVLRAKGVVMRLKALFGAVLLLGSLTACGLNVNAALPYDVKPGSIQEVSSLKGLNVTVGSKDCTENIILGYMAELALSAAG